MKFILLLFFIPYSVSAQQSDILLLQKNHRTVRQFYAGSPIEFYTTEHTGVSAVVDYFKEDSLFLLQYDIRMAPTFGGGFAPDTLAVYHVNYSLKNIYSFPANPRKFNFITNGTLFMLGGGAYLVLNLVNTLREKEPYFGKDNLPNIIGGAASLGLGILLNKTQVKEYKVGKKYQLKYLAVTSPAKE